MCFLRVTVLLLTWDCNYNNPVVVCVSPHSAKNQKDRNIEGHLSGHQDWTSNRPVLREGAGWHAPQCPGVPQTRVGHTDPIALIRNRVGADRAWRSVLWLWQHAAGHHGPPAVQSQQPGRKADGAHGEMGQSTSRLVSTTVMAASQMLLMSVLGHIWKQAKKKKNTAAQINGNVCESKAVKVFIVTVRGVEQ